MSNLVFLRDGQAVTTSEAIASGVSVQHKNLLSILLDFLLALKDEDSLLSHGASLVISSMGSCC